MSDHDAERVPEPTAEARPAAESCSNCKFFSALKTRCRRNAPNAFPVQIDAATIRFIKFWPPCDASDWCGEYKPDDGVMRSPGT